MSDMHRADATVDDAVLRKKEQKDVELDKKILALRKKNEALIRRYQEIEEDKKRAEQEGMAVTSRKPKQDGLTITITKAHNDLKDAITQTEHYGQDSQALSMDKRVVSEKKSPCPVSTGFGIGSEEEEEEEEADHMFTFRMGKRMQLAVTMDNKAKGKRIVSEKRTECFPGPGRMPDLSEEETDHLVAFRRGRRMQIAITMDNKEKVEERRAVEKRRSDSDRGPESEHSRKEGGKSVQKCPGDLSFPLSGRERSEYIRWKRERDQIDLERVARHKNAKGEWRRAWDVEKSEHMGKKRKEIPAQVLPSQWERWDAKEGEDTSFLKDDPDSQRNLGTDKQKSKGEEVVEENCTAELEEKVKAPSLQEHGRRGGKAWPAHNGQKEERRRVKGLSKEVSEASTGDLEPRPKASKEHSEEDGNRKPGSADIPQEKESTNSSASQSGLPSAVQATKHGSEETLLLPVGADLDGGGLEKKTASEQESTEDSSNSHGGKLDTDAGDRLDADQGQLVGKRGEEVAQNTAPAGQTLALKGAEDAEDIKNTGEPLPTKKDNSNETVVPEQDMAKLQSREGDQPEDGKDKDSRDTLD
ncbi:coiled-coil domain-containing protein 9B isoform X5 [Gallus gallus]|uniref:coiled-coil domain-containing protein 9B isoform X5 n=1 Tax=Gallus gallus TaxID=9031 RepID=UPI001AE54B7E|nr:coiled-coil domain-containing protein 9B isoform X5 [Gallus gallus]